MLSENSTAVAVIFIISRLFRIAFFGCIGFVIFKLAKNLLSKKKPLNPVTYDPLKGMKALKNIRDYHNVDPDFSELNFVNELTSIYIRLEYGRQRNNIDDMRMYFTDECFANIQREIKLHPTNAPNFSYSPINIVSAHLEGWSQDENRDIITAKIRANQPVCTDEGENKTHVVACELKIVRTKGLNTKQISEISVQNCPNCGAPVNINHSAVCSYCNSVLTSETFNWAIDSIKITSK